MDRAKATQQLVRIIGAIEAGSFPTGIKELYVFGSYARGALKPGDLDLILVHEPPPEELIDRIKRTLVKKYGRYDILEVPASWPERRFKIMMRNVMRRPGEKMDILLGTSLDDAVRNFRTISAANRTLLWSESDRRWRGKLNSIKIDKRARRYERGHFAEVRRFRGGVGSMKAISKAIKSLVLKLTKLDAERITPELNPIYQDCYDHWVFRKVMGKQSMRLLKHGMWWMQQQRGQAWQCPHPVRGDNELWSDDAKYIVYFGHPPLFAVHRLTEKQHRALRICLLPHFKRGQPSILYVLERGDRFSEKRFDDIWRTR